MSSTVEKVKRIVLLIIRLAIVLLILFFATKFFTPLFHFDFSQDYRRIKGAAKIIFWDHWEKAPYVRCFWGLRKGTAKGKYPELNQEGDWMGASVFDISDSGRLAAWYEPEEDKICLSSTGGGLLKEFEVTYEVNQIVFSPDEENLLYQEIEYNIYGGYSSDEEYSYYRAINMETGKVVTIFKGYREWYQLSWEK